MSGSQIRIALFGYGHWGRIVERYLKASSAFELVYVFSPSLNKEGIYINDYTLALGDHSIDAVYIATPASSHFKLAFEALNAGKNVLIEKPMVLNIDEAMILDTLSKSSRLSLETGYVYTHSPGVMKVKELLPTIGTVRSCDMTLSQLGRFYEENVYEVLGCHLLSILDVLWKLEGFSFSFENMLHNVAGVCETGAIHFSRDSLVGRMFLSLNTCERSRKIHIVGDLGSIIFDPLCTETVRSCTYTRDGRDARIDSEESHVLDEANNLERELSNFREIVYGRREDNRPQALAICRILSAVR